MPTLPKDETTVAIREASIDEVVALSERIPEFIDPHGVSEYRSRLEGKPSLVLAAYHQGTAVGFKVGYQKASDGSFYSWMGAVLPSYRKAGVASLLAHHQEQWAKAQGYNRIRFKTRNNLKAMQIFALKRGFHIIAIEPRAAIPEYRIIMEKPL